MLVKQGFEAQEEFKNFQEKAQLDLYEVDPEKEGEEWMKKVTGICEQAIKDKADKIIAKPDGYLERGILKTPNTKSNEDGCFLLRSMDSMGYGPGVLLKKEESATSLICSVGEEQKQPVRLEKRTSEASSKLSSQLSILKPKSKASSKLASKTASLNSSKKS